MKPASHGTRECQAQRPPGWGRLFAGVRVAFGNWIATRPRAAQQVLKPLLLAVKQQVAGFCERVSTSRQLAQP